MQSATHGVVADVVVIIIVAGVAIIVIVIMIAIIVIRVEVTMDVAGSSRATVPVESFAVIDACIFDPLL